MILVGAWVCIGLVFSQNLPDPGIVMESRIESIDLFMDYVRRKSDLNNPDRYVRREFVKLFSEDAVLYNDYLPNNENSSLTPQQYAELRKGRVNVITENVSDLSLGNSFREGNVWYVDLHYTENQIIVFYEPKRLEYPKISYRCRMRVRLTENVNRGKLDRRDMSSKALFSDVKIERISVENPIGKYSFVYLENLEDTVAFSMLKTYDNLVDDNPYLLMIEADSIDMQNVGSVGSYFFPSTIKVHENGLPGYYRFSRVKRDNIKIGLGYVPWGIGGSIDKSLAADLFQMNMTSSLDIQYGILLGAKSKNIGFFNLGLGANYNRSKVTGSFQTQYSEIDSDNEAYQRKILLNRLSENISYWDICFRPGFEWLIQIGKTKNSNFMFLSLEVGGYISYRFGAKNDVTFKGRYTGLYDYFGGVELEHYYDFGEFDVVNSDIEGVSLPELNVFDYGFFSAIGFWHTFNEHNLLKISLGYKQGFVVPFSRTDNITLSENRYNYFSSAGWLENGLRDISLQISWILTINRKK